MTGLTVTGIGTDVIDVGRDLYVKTPEALALLLSELTQIGYKITDLRKEEYRQKKGTPVETMEKNGWSLWFANLEDLRRGKCTKCESYIDTRGIQSHGHRCENCGQLTYREILNGSKIRFHFNNPPGTPYRMFSPELYMEVYRFDPRGWVYFKPEFIKAGGLCVVSGEKAEAYLAMYADKWTRVTAWGQDLYKIAYTPHTSEQELPISVHEIYGHKWGHKIVKLWDGKEYGDWDHLPIPESFSIYETWHWAPLPKSPTLYVKVLRAVGQTEDKGWHSGDSPWFNSNHWEEMGKFIRHFTTLDADAYDIASKRFRTSGPGGIDDIAHFCDKDSVLVDEPNIGNVLYAMGKMLDGRQLSENEITRATKGLADPTLKRLTD